MKHCTPTKLSDYLKTRRAPSSYCPSSSGSSGLLLVFPLVTKKPSPVYLSFLYPAQPHQIRHASVSPSEISTKTKKPDPWAFLYGTSEADDLEPPQFTSHFRPQVRSRNEPPRRSRVSSLSSFQIQRQRANRDVSSTITERERAIFARIFESILSEGPAPSASGGEKDRTTQFPSPSLRALFESAVGPQFNRSELTFGPRSAIFTNSASLTAAMAKASAMADYPPSLRAAVARAAGLSQYPLSEQELKDEGARQAELAVLLGKMKSCKTDLELSDFMDKHVFSMVRNESDPPPEETSSTSQEPVKEPVKRQRGRPRKSTVLKIEGKNYIFPSASYADLLFEGMRMLHKMFRDLPGMIAIFERVKRLGPESYVIGCTVSVYNQILEAKWEGYRDIFKIEALLEEMVVNGIQGDAGTVEVLRKISTEALRMTDPGSGPWGMGAALLTEDEKECLARVDLEADRLVNKLKENIRYSSLAKKAKEAKEGGEVIQQRRRRDAIEKELMAL